MSIKPNNFAILSRLTLHNLIKAHALSVCYLRLQSVYNSTCLVKTKIFLPQTKKNRLI